MNEMRLLFMSPVCTKINLHMFGLGVFPLSGKCYALWIYIKSWASKFQTQVVNSELIKLCLVFLFLFCSLHNLCSDHGNQPQWCGVCVLFMIPIDSSGLNLLLWVFRGSIMEYCQQVKGNFVFVKSILWKLTSASKSETRFIIFFFFLTI